METKVRDSHWFLADWTKGPHTFHIREHGAVHCRSCQCNHVDDTNIGGPCGEPAHVLTESEHRLWNALLER
jgi:hypothetical protein